MARPRGSTSARGYGTQYQRIRAEWKIRVNTGTVRCWRSTCGRLIHPLEPWHLGHDDYDRRIIRGPEHAGCNLAAAARKTNAIRRAKHGMQAAQPRRSRRW